MYEYIKQEKKNKYQASNRIYMLPCKNSEKAVINEKYQYVRIRKSNRF